MHEWKVSMCHDEHRAVTWALIPLRSIMMSCLFVGVINVNHSGFCLLAEQRRRNRLWYSHRSVDEKSGPTPAPTPALARWLCWHAPKPNHHPPHPFSQASETVIHYQQNPTSHSSQTFTPPAPPSPLPSPPWLPFPPWKEDMHLTLSIVSTFPIGQFSPIIFPHRTQNLE